jgi:hypothetical protein
MAGIVEYLGRRARRVWMGRCREYCRIVVDRDNREVAQKPHDMQGLFMQLFLNSAAAIWWVI